MAHPKSQNQQNVTIAETLSTKRNFAFIIAAVLLVATIFLFRGAEQANRPLVISPDHEFPVLYRSNGAVKAEILYDEPSIYGRVVVFDDPVASDRYLLIDGAINNNWSYILPGAPGRFGAIAAIMESHTVPIEDVAMIGLGAGFLLKAWDGADYSVDVAEINPRVVSVAETYFGTPKELLYTVFEDDGRHFLRSKSKLYDTIVVDLCDITGSSAHLFTSEFYDLAKTKLRTGGLFITTLNILKDEQGINLAARVAETLGGTFANVYTFGADISGGLSPNPDLDFVTFIASDTPLNMSSVSEVALKQWEARGDISLIRDSNTPSIVSAHLPVLEALRDIILESFGTRIFLGS